MNSLFSISFLMNLEEQRRKYEHANTEKEGSIEEEMQQKESWVFYTQESQGLGLRWVPTIEGKPVNNKGPSPETVRNNQKLL